MLYGRSKNLTVAAATVVCDVIAVAWARMENTQAAKMLSKIGNAYGAIVDEAVDYQDYQTYDEEVTW